MQNGASIAVLTSGGIDSAVLAVELARRYPRVVPIYIRAGLRWEAVERYWAERFLETAAQPGIAPMRVLDLPVADLYGEHWSTGGRPVPDAASDWQDVYLPGRNLILLAKTALFCALNNIGAVALGPLKGNRFPDSARAFFDAFAGAVASGLEHRLEVLTPFAQLSKDEVIFRGRGLRLELTFSCIDPQGIRHCGACNKCAERIQAFASAGLPDRTSYARRLSPARVRSVATGGLERSL